MKFDAVFILFALSLLSMALFHNIALQASLYWLYPWFDMPMHFLGGAVVALGFLVARERLVHLRFETLLLTLAIVLLVGIAWEIFEWYFRLIDTIGYVKDTITDLCLDLSGGAVAYGIARSFRSVGM